MLKCRIAPHLKLLVKNDDTIRTGIEAKHKISSKNFNVLLLTILYQIYNLIGNSANNFDSRNDDNDIFTTMIIQRMSMDAQKKYNIRSQILAKQDCFLRKNLINYRNKDVIYEEYLFFMLHLLKNMLIFCYNYNTLPSIIYYSNLHDAFTVSVRGLFARWKFRLMCLLNY